MEQLTLGALFAGIGGFELAATWAGIKPVWSNEIDKYACKVLRKNFDHEIIEKDIRTIGRKELRFVDIISAGVPCQPASVAGKRKGTKDDRWLWDENLRIISEVGPTYVICENPPGILSLENGRPFQQILYALENEGYQLEIYNIPACGVGAWHRRERLWIIAYSNNHSDTGRLDYREDTETSKGGKRQNQQQRGRGENRKRIRTESNSSIKITSNLNLEMLERSDGPQKPIRPYKGGSGYDRQRREIEPELVRLVHGIPRRMDRIRGLGNTIDPHIAYELFKAILNTY